MGLLEPNGAGKTTLIRVLLGLYEYEGKINFDQSEQKKIDVIKQGHRSQSGRHGIHHCETERHSRNRRSIREA